VFLYDDVATTPLLVDVIGWFDTHKNTVVIEFVPKQSSPAGLSITL
jgi:hypothetical protein